MCGIARCVQEQRKRSEKEPANNQTFLFFFFNLFVKRKVFEDNLLMTKKRKKSKRIKQHFLKPTVMLSHATQSFCVLRWLRLQIIVSSRFRLLCTCGAAAAFEDFAVFCSNSKANLSDQTSPRRHRSILLLFFLLSRPVNQTFIPTHPPPFFLLLCLAWAHKFTF